MYIISKSHKFCIILCSQLFTFHQCGQHLCLFLALLSSFITVFAKISSYSSCFYSGVIFILSEVHLLEGFFFFFC